MLSKVLWQIVPFLLICYIFAYLERVNVGVAGLTLWRKNSGGRTGGPDRASLARGRKPIVRTGV